MAVQTATDRSKPIAPRMLAKGEKVTEPGLYANIDIDFYHGDCTDGPGISSSGLRRIEQKSPAHYYAESYLNPERQIPESGSHFDFGKAAHALFLGEPFREKFAVRPDAWSDWRTNAAKSWRAEQEMAGRTVLVPDDLAVLKKIHGSLEREPLISKSGLLEGKVEHSLIWRDKITGVWLRARPDVLPESDGVAVDLKTTTDASPDAIQRSCVQLGYPMQGALLGMGMKAVLGVEMTDFVLVWIEKNPPYAVNISPVDPEWIFWAMRQLRRAIDTFARCVEKNEWPGYQGEITTSMPGWLKSRFEFEAKNGLIPEVDEVVQ